MGVFDLCRFRPTQTELCRFGWVWSSLINSTREIARSATNKDPKNTIRNISKSFKAPPLPLENRSPFEVPKLSRSKCGRTRKKNAKKRKRTQMTAKERKCKFAKELRRAQKGTKERKRASLRKNCKQLGLKQLGLGTDQRGWPRRGSSSF